MLCYYGDDMEEYRRWEDNIKMDLKEIGVIVSSWPWSQLGMSKARSSIIREQIEHSRIMDILAHTSS